ncbi:hypothetical protein FH972_014634 [Carpinus fangiana]|uniref:Uncharacterized protein n=1 Tax=Carpinus fangiana TaxID=176857 RepID=A0A5N6RA79_9ROSI|nr:hypothetical protein FH972_014634 [Carpinus fangiana]
MREFELRAPPNSNGPIHVSALESSYKILPIVFFLNFSNSPYNATGHRSRPRKSTIGAGNPEALTGKQDAARTTSAKDGIFPPNEGLAPESSSPDDFSASSTVDTNQAAQWYRKGIRFEWKAFQGQDELKNMIMYDGSSRLR